MKTKRIVYQMFAAILIISMLSLFAAGVGAVGSGGNVWDGTTGTSFDGGSGTEDDPYLISSGQSLAYLASLVNSETDRQTQSGKFFRMTNNIDLGDLEWTPIGNYYNGSSSASRFFSGTFDGNGYRITNLNAITAQGKTVAGLFGCVWNGTVKNLGIESGTVSTASTNGGGIAGVVKGRSLITNCYNNATVIRSVANSSQCFMGGLVGNITDANAVISECINYGYVDAAIALTNGNSGYGGICGFAQFGTIKDCLNFGSVNCGVKVNFGGGICGTVTDQMTVSGCSSSGLVFTGGSTSAYLIGKASAAPTITDCTAYTKNYAEYPTGKITVGDLEYTLATAVCANGASYITNCTVNTSDTLSLDAADAPVMLDGAAVRLVKDSSGIRFTSNISAELLERVRSEKDADTEIVIGTIICPADYIEGRSAFTMDVIEAVGKQYVNIIAESGITYDPSGNATVRAALTNIYESNYARDFAARAYVKYIKGGEAVYVYSAFDSANNCRSIAEVASCALADVQTVMTEEYCYAVDGGYSRYNAAQRSVLVEYCTAYN